MILVGMERCVVLCIWSLLACGSAGQVKEHASRIQQELPNGNFGVDNTNTTNTTNTTNSTMLLGLLKASESKLAKSDDSTTAPTMTSAPSGNSAPSSSRGKGASVESPPSDFYPRTKGKKSKGGEKMKKSKSEGASKSRIKNSKKSKKSRSKKGEESMTPTSPGETFPPSDDPLPTAPPSGMPTPSSPPSPTTILRVLTAYTLEYTTTNDRIPFRSEYLEVVEVTRSYLSGFFIDQFANSDQTLLTEFLTLFVDSRFDFDQPVPIEYESTAIFDNSSAVVPGVAMLDRTLESAFEGDNLNGFIGMLQALPQGNVFSTTIFVEKTDAHLLIVSSSFSNSGAGATTAGAVAGAAGFALLVAGLMVYKRRQGPDASEDIPTKKLWGTVSGNESVAGETYTEGWSVGQASETQPFQSYTDQEQVDFRIVDEGMEDDVSEGEDTTLGGDTDLTDVALEWDGGLRSISLSR